ncbi:hypothetical protein MXAN_1761 [Myxococcus xanthus DK 1622]|uniref:Uncharacterized protein n=1 Tax=Myxococcus xanthus (strain DK1622) TaxID=246197 RepID=Q1DBG1_MYXXD|nr:hypothetical protein MXAN_1761 [Myxococcus xanthus DK 1622]
MQALRTLEFAGDQYPIPTSTQTPLEPRTAAASAARWAACTSSSATLAEAARGIALLTKLVG